MRIRPGVVSIAAVLSILLASGSVRAGVRDAMAAVAECARANAAHAGPVRWATPVDFESADVMCWQGPDRLLVGTVASDAKLAVPRHGPIVLYDTATGAPVWEASRAPRPSGSYQLLALEPVVLLMGSDAARVDLTALDPATGAKRWTFGVAPPLAFDLADDRVVVLAPRTGSLQSLDLRSGEALWTRKLAPDPGSPSGPPALALAGPAVVVVGTNLAAFAALDGTPLWSSKPEAPPGETVALPMDEGLLLWSARGAALLDPTRGTLRWRHDSPDGDVKGVYRSTSRILLVRSGRDGDGLEALEPASGRPLWTRAAGGRVTSPAVTAGPLVVLTTDDAVVGLKAADGAPAFRTSLAPAFVAGSPSRAPVLGAPDRLAVRGDHLILWRDAAGVCALALPKGALLWSQGPITGGSPGYTMNEAANLLLQVRGLPATAAPKLGLLPLGTPGPNPFLVAAERRNDEVAARTARTLASSRSTSGDRKAAILDRQIASGAAANQGMIDSSFDRARSALDMAVGMIGAAQAWRRAQQERAQEGLRQRYTMLAQAAMRRELTALQGPFLLDPFIARGRGVGISLVNLDTGKRADVLYAPLVGPLLDYSVDLLAYAVDPSATTLVTVGVGFDPARHSPMGKWRCRLPRLSLMALDLTKLSFGPTSPLQELVASESTARLITAPAVAPAPASGAAPDGETPLTLAIRRKEREAALALIADGADLSVTGAYGDTPLFVAARQCDVEIMQACLEHGADPNARNAAGDTPLLHMVNQGFGFVHGDRMVAAAELLLKHGAKTDFTCIADMPMVTYASRQSPKLAALFRRYGRK